MTTTTYLAYIVAVYFVYWSVRRVLNWWYKPEGTIDVPIVAGCWPIVGHALSFTKDIPKFIQEAHAKYGDVFRIKMFNINMMVVCDRKLIDEYFKKTESNMSLYEILGRLYFSDAFSDDPVNLVNIMTFVKSNITLKFDDFVIKIRDEAEKMTNNLKQLVRDNNGQHTINLTEEMIRFVANTSAKCFMSYEMTSEFYNTLIKFSHLLNKIVVLTSFVPKWVLRIVFNRRVQRCRKQMTASLVPEIEKYRADPDKCDSHIFRKAVDTINPRTQKPMTNDDIGDIIVCLLYVSSENTALGLSAAMLDLARHPDWWNRIRGAANDHLSGSSSGGLRSLFADETIDACVMESARMNTHVFALQRKPMRSGSTLGKWYISRDINSIALCQPMLMLYEKAQDVFKNPLVYNPDRFIVGQEPKDAKSVMAWGAGIHLCPGKTFALYEIKTATALLCQAFEPFGILQAKKDYFSPSAFAETDAKVTLILKPSFCPDLKIARGWEDRVTTIVIPKTNGDSIQIVRIVADEKGNAGWLLKNYMSLSEQEIWYRYTQQLSAGSAEQLALISGDLDLKKPAPLSYYKLVYTDGSNCHEPVRWLKWAQSLWRLFHDHADTLQFPRDLYDDEYFNSMYSQMYHAQSTMKPHKDEYVDWGVSVSLGASCDFSFGKHKLVLNSGDILIADFSKILHSIDQVHDNTQPTWFNDNNAGIQIFDRARCSIQLRSVQVKVPEMTMDMLQFGRLINQ